MQKVLALVGLIILLVFGIQVNAQGQTSTINSRGLSLEVKSIDLPQTQVLGDGSTRGAALAVLASGDYLIGGERKETKYFFTAQPSKNLKRSARYFQETSDSMMLALELWT